MPLGSRVLRHRLIAGACGLALVCIVFGIDRSERRWCSQCWAPMETNELALGATDDWRVPVAKWTSVRDEPDPRVARFVAPGHVHDAAERGLGFSQRGPYVFCQLIGCGRNLPSEFAWALSTDSAFSDFVAARVADGTVDIETVRRWISVPSYRERDEWLDDAAHRDLLRRANEFHAGFSRDHSGPDELFPDVAPQSAPGRPR